MKKNYFLNRSTDILLIDPNLRKIKEEKLNIDRIFL